MKKTFTYRTEWSDRSEHSPHTVGQLPDFVKLPDGERVDLQPDDRDPFMQPSKAGYVQVHENVRVRYTFWGDNGTRRAGRAGGRVDIIAPKGSTFFFEQRCPLCGELTGHVTEFSLLSNGRPPENWHEDCARQAQQMR
jgi:hypothetical protein